MIINQQDLLFQTHIIIFNSIGTLFVILIISMTIHRLFILNLISIVPISQ